MHTIPLNPHQPWRGVYSVWLRNAKVWRKLAVPSLLANVADPLMALVAFGFGLGSLLPSLDGRPYLHYLACGALAMSAMNAATFEALYSAFSRMHVQKTWDSIMNTPVALPEIVLGEWLWAATKSVMSTTIMMAVVALLGVGHWQFWCLAIPVLWLGALMFSAIGLCVNAKAPGYDFFMFYFTLAVTPMTFLSGAFFPRSQLPEWLGVIAQYLPLSVLVDAVRSLLSGDLAVTVKQSGILLIYTLIAIRVALRLSRARFSNQ